MKTSSGTSKLRMGWGLFLASMTLLGPAARPSLGEEPAAADGWTTASPREEIRPEFRYETEGAAGRGQLVIKAGGREGGAGCWRKTIPVVGGKSYRFQAHYLARGVALPRRSVVAEIHWRDEEGRKVPTDQPTVAGYLRGSIGIAETEFPSARGADAEGWTEVSDTYRAPAGATRAIVELHLRWAPDGEVRWRGVSLVEAAPSSPRPVRLATVHFLPGGGKDPAENCRMFEPMIAEAARQKADLVVLGETLTYPGLGRKYHEVAEAVPGPSTDYFGGLAKKHDLYIVAGLLERDGALVYNVAALIGPDGKLVGKYRKVCLPRGEVEGGIAPGSGYPVFSTRFGRVGLMVCYDGFFPEVARELTNRGAEVIAWPVWGCNPLLARARACENQVYIVSSTYEEVSSNWMVSAVFDHSGELIAQAKARGEVAVAEVDLNRRTHWISLGDFKAQLPSHRPPAVTPTSPTVDDSPAPGAVRAAVEKGLLPILKSMRDYPESRDCFSCHHQAVPTLALATAKGRGFAIEAEAIAEAVEHTEADLLGALESYRKGAGQPGGVTRAGYALFTLEVGGKAPDDVTGAVAEYLLKRDGTSDHWRVSSARPPSEASEFTATYVALRALAAYGTDEQKSRIAGRVEKARQWLAKSRPKDTEDRAFRLLALRQVSAPEGAIGEATADLLATRRGDGGWAQLDGGTSDAYATGSALVALHLAGGLATDSPAYRGGLKFLIADQRGDGSWFVASRSKPFQTYFESGFPYGKDQFISMTASSWAMTALALACPAK